MAIAGATYAALLVLCGAIARAEDAASQATATTPAVDETIDAAGADGDTARRQLVSWNHYEGPYITARVGGGFLWDYSAYAQDENSKQQMTLSPTDGVRDFRLLLKARAPGQGRPLPARPARRC